MGLIFRTAVIILLSVALAACQSVGDRRKSPWHHPEPSSQESFPLHTQTQGESVSEIISSAQSESSESEEQDNIDQILEDSESFQLAMSKPIQMWKDYFTGRGRKWFQRALDRGAPIMSTMRAMLVQEGLPADIVYLSLIESGFNNIARSRSRAVGAWQFMKWTGKNYGLKITPWIDERRDPIKATQAAIKYLSDLHDMFDNWYLAITAYNAGENKISRAITRYRTRDAEKLLKYHYLKRETRNYVPKLIAAIEIAKNSEKYGFQKPHLTPYTYATVLAKKPVSLNTFAKHLDISYTDLRDLNAELIASITPPEMEYPLKVPVELKDKAESVIANAYAKIPTSPYATYYIHRGDSLWQIANRYGTTTSVLKQINASLTHNNQLRIGQRLLVPVTPKYAAHYASKSIDRVVAAADSDAASSDGGGTTAVASASDAKSKMIHTVRTGESLWSISQKYGISIGRIKRANAAIRSRIFPGQRLIIPTA